MDSLRTYKKGLYFWTQMSFLRLLFLPLFLFIASSLEGQVKWRAGLFTGIKYGLVNTPGGTEIQSLPDGSSTVKQINYNLGKGFTQGIKIDLGKDSAASFFTLGIFYSKGARSHFDGSLTSAKSYNYTFLENRNLQLFAGTGIQFNLKKIKLVSAAGLLIPFYNKTLSYNYLRSDTLSSVLTRTITYKKSLGLELRQEIHYPVNRDFSLYSGISLGLLSMNRYSSRLTNYSDSKGRSLTQAYPHLSDQFTYYLSDNEIASKGSINNPQTNKSNFDINKATETFSLSEPFSYFMVSVGLVWSF